jgi:hypothetical protein
MISVGVDVRSLGKTSLNLVLVLFHIKLLRLSTNAHLGCYWYVSYRLLSAIRSAVFSVALCAVKYDGIRFSRTWLIYVPYEHAINLYHVPNNKLFGHRITPKLHSS